MHVGRQPIRPTSISLDVPAEMLDKERAMLIEQTKPEKKPPEIIAKMVEGRLRKYVAEITLVGQPFVKDLDITIEKLLKGAGAKVVQFVRYEVGAGIEKKQDDFVNEVMKQVKAQEKDQTPTAKNASLKKTLRPNDQQNRHGTLSQNFGQIIRRGAAGG